MPTYVYKARDDSGRPVKGRLEASNKDELTDRLRRMGYMTTQISQALPGIKIESLFERLRGISDEDMVMFNLQLSDMINAGISISASLSALYNQAVNKKLKDATGAILRNIEAGDSFGQALARYPGIFSPLFISMVKAGEASGKLDRILSSYAQFVEYQADLRQKIKGALFYPAILFCAGIVVTLFIVTFIVPQFAGIFMKAGIKLPLPTLILYGIGTAIKRFWHLLVLSVILAGWLIRYYVSTENGRLKFDRFKLRLPVTGPLQRKVAVSRFSRTLSILVASGVPILEALDIAREVLANAVLSGVIKNARNAVEKGERIAESFKISQEFPAHTIQMIAAGEETGNLDGMLNKISDFYDMSIGYSIKKLTTILEPLLLVIMGGMIGFIMASLLIPIFDMIKILRY